MKQAKQKTKVLFLSSLVLLKKKKEGKIKANNMRYETNENHGKNLANKLDLLSLLSQN